MRVRCGSGLGEELRGGRQEAVYYHHTFFFQDSADSNDSRQSAATHNMFGTMYSKADVVREHSRSDDEWRAINSLENARVGTLQPCGLVVHVASINSYMSNGNVPVGQGQVLARPQLNFDYHKWWENSWNSKW